MGYFYYTRSLLVPSHEAPVTYQLLRQPNLPEGTHLKVDIVLILSGNTEQDVFVTDIVSALAYTPNHRGDGFYYDLAAKEYAKRSKYYKCLISPWHFFPLAFRRTNVLSRDTLRFCEVVGSYFPNVLKIEAKIRACLSRAITSGVAATFNDEMRQLQLSTLNAVASSMVPPAPDRRAKDSALVGLKSSMNAPASVPLSSVLTLHNRLSAIVSRDESQCSSTDVDGPSSLSSGLLSQLSEGNLSVGLGT